MMSTGYFLLAALSLLLGMITVIDIRRMIIPDMLTLAIATLALPWIVFGPIGWKEAMFGATLAAIIGYGLRLGMKHLLRKPALGLGDVKLMAALGLWIGLQNLSLFFIATGIGGVLFGLAWRVARRGHLFPLGPALAASSLFTLVLQLKG